MDSLFASIEERRIALRLTEPEFLDAAGIGRVRFWRAKSGRVSGDTRLVVLREAEAALSRMEGSEGPTSK